MKNTSENTDLADLVADLQNVSSIPSSSKKETLSLTNEATTDLDQFLSPTLHTDLKCEKVSYIDPDIHDVLAMIKRKRGVPIGILLSYLAQEFITNHKAAIKTLFAQNDILK